MEKTNESNSTKINKPVLYSDKITKKVDGEITKTDSFTVDELHKFYNDFIESQNKILSKISSLNKEIIEKPESFDLNNTKLLEIESDLRNLKDHFQLNSMFLVPFDRFNYIKLLDETDKEVSLLKQLIQPKKKFKFSNKPKEKNENNNQDKDTIKSNETTEINGNKSSNLMIFSKEDFVLTNLKNTTYEVKKEDLEGKKNLLLDSIENCEVFLQVSFKSLFAKNIKNCKLYLGGISGGSHLTNVENSKIYLCTHQLRIHDSTDTLYAVVVNSDPIIENSKGLVFSPLDKILNYENLNKILDECSLKIENNKYASVKDFQWLKQEKSPNFTIDDCSTQN